MPLPRRTNTALFSIPMLAAIACIIFVIVLAVLGTRFHRPSDVPDTTEAFLINVL